MNSLSRIRSSSIQYGNSFVIGGHESNQDSEFGTTEDIRSLSNMKKQLEVEIDNLNQELQALRQEKDSIILDANTQAQGILEKSNLEAEEIKTTASKEVEEIKTATYEQALKEGNEKGYQEGLSKGFEDIKLETNKKIEALSSLVDASFEIKREIVLSAEKDILDIAVMLAEKLINIELSQNKDVLVNVIKSALSELKEKEEVKILINPSVAEVVYSISDDLKENIKGLEQIKIVEDKTISPDGVIVESVDSRVDARLSTQLSKIIKNLEEERENNPVLKEIPQEVEEKIKKKQTKRTAKKKDD